MKIAVNCCVGRIWLIVHYIFLWLNAINLYLDWIVLVFVACEQAPGGASAEQTFGAKCRAIGACTHSTKSPMSASKFWTQSGDWWIIIIHDVILVSTSGILRQKSKWRKGEKWFLEGLERIYQVIWNWSPNSVMQWSIFSTTMMCSPFFLQDMAKAIFFNSLLLLLRLKGKSHRLYVLVDTRTPAETFPKFPLALRVIDRSDRNPPITAC